jgi:hypothetical protein
VTAITSDSSISLGPLGALIVKGARLVIAGGRSFFTRGSAIKRESRGGHYNKHRNQRTNSNST